MACSLKIHRALTKKVEDLSEKGLNAKSISEANEIASDINNMFKEDVVKFVIPKKEATMTNTFKSEINNINQGKVKNVSEKFTEEFYNILSEKSISLLKKDGITKENFHKSFNEELSKDSPSNWFKSIINEILKLLGEKNLTKIIDSLKSESLDNFLTEGGDMLVYGITSSQKTKIPLINKMLFKGITPTNYNIKRVISKLPFNLVLGSNYNEYKKEVKKFFESDVFQNVNEANKKIPEWATNVTEDQYNKRLDAWRLSNGLPQLHNTFIFKGKGYLDENYNLVEDSQGENVYDFVDPMFDIKTIEKGSTTGIDKGNFVMGSYAISLGSDSIGQYFQYNDRWDLDITQPFIKSVIDTTQKPFIVSGRIYKAMTYDENGNAEFYNTYDTDNVDIKEYNNFLDHVNQKELLDEEPEFTNLKPCFI